MNSRTGSYLFLLVAMLLISPNSYNQDYIPFNFQDGIWIEEEFCKGDMINRQLFCKGDTLINNQTYNKLYEFTISFYEPGYYPDTIFTHYVGAIRNNESKQVLYRSTWDTSDIIIYDFNLNLGDTIDLADGKFIITDIDSVEYCGRYHKRYIESLSFPFFPIVLVEGIGFSNGLLGYYGYFGNGEYYNQLICYTERNNRQCADCKLWLEETEYIPMLGNTNQWYVLYSPEGAYTNIITTKGDTLIRNKTYKILGYQHIANIPEFIREDTIERKVYMLPNSIKDTFEIVYFDFSLNENDSILLYSTDYDSLGYFRVDSVRNISTLAGIRRAIYLNDLRIFPYWTTPVWVEGIGTLGTIDCRECWPEFEKGELNCFYKDGVKIYQSKFSRSLDTCIIGWSGVDDFESKSVVVVYPNPATSEINIKLKNDLPFKVYIFDLYGRLCLEGKNRTKIDLNNLSNGTYILKVLVQNKTHTQKLVIMK